MSSRSAVLKVDVITDARGSTAGIAAIDNKFARLGSNIAKYGKMAAIGLGVGLAAAAVGAVKLAQGAAEDQAAQAKLALSLQNTTDATHKQVDAVERWITKQGVARGGGGAPRRPPRPRQAGQLDRQYQGRPGPAEHRHGRGSWSRRVAGNGHQGARASE